MPLGLPRSTAPLYDAIVAALTTDQTGDSRPLALPTDRLYTLGRPADFLDGAKARNVFGGVGKRGRPRCWVAPIQLTPDVALQMSDRRRYEVSVEIRCWYWTHEINTAAWRAVVDEIHADAALLGPALCYPSAIYAAPDGTRTGLDGGAVMTIEHRPIVPLPSEPRVLQATYVARASIELTAPGADIGTAP